MSNLPDYEPQRIQEGHYVFTITGDPELRRHNSGSDKEFVSVQLKFKGIDEDGDEVLHAESFLPFEERYADLGIALGAEKDDKGKVHISKLRVVGLRFQADIIYEQDKKDPLKKWPRLTNIQAVDSQSATDDSEGDDVPF